MGHFSLGRWVLSANILGAFFRVGSFGPCVISAKVFRDNLCMTDKWKEVLQGTMFVVWVSFYCKLNSTHI